MNPPKKHNRTAKSAFVPLVYVNVNRDKSAVGPILISGVVPNRI